MFARSSDRKNALAETPAQTIDRPMDRVLRALIVGAAYYLGALVGYALKFPNHAPSALWPPNSILLAALLLTPTRSWPVMLAGAVGSSRVDLQACKLEYSIVSPK